MEYGQIVNFIIKFWQKGQTSFKKNRKFYEQKNLQLDIQKAKKLLNWWPTYGIEKSVKITAEWYYLVKGKKLNAYEVTKKQIIKYTILLKKYNKSFLKKSASSGESLWDKFLRFLPYGLWGSFDDMFDFIN